MLDNDLFDFLEREIDETATFKRVRRVLKNYIRLKPMISLGEDVGTSKLSHTGHIRKQGTHGDVVGNSVARRVEAQEELKEIDRALKTVSEEYYRVLLA